MSEKKQKDSVIPDRSDCIYTSCYCEENIWKMCQHVKESNPDQLKHCYCVFISNENRTIPLWFQKSNQEDSAVVWDYHVLMIYKDDTGSLVYDLDTTLPFPCAFDVYAVKAIRDNRNYRQQYHRYFRVIPGLEFLATFASDRSHMLNEDGSWKMEPPSYPCIKTENSSNNIQDFISMKKDTGHGIVLDFQELLKKF